MFLLNKTKVLTTSCRKTQLMKAEIYKLKMPSIHKCTNSHAFRNEHCYVSRVNFTGKCCSAQTFANAKEPNFHTFCINILTQEGEIWYFFFQAIQK